MVDIFEDTLSQLIVRVNGGIHKSQAENVIEFSDSEKPSLREIKKNTCKRFGCKEKAGNSLIYSKKGIQLFDEDINFIQPNDILYIALDGEKFNNCAILDDYKISEKIGQGGFGTVHLATNKETQKQYAVKFMDMTASLHQADEVNMIYKEANSLVELRHKNIVELYHAFLEGKQLIMIMELAKGGELMEYVQKKGILPEKDARNILLQIISAIQYCHSNGVVHRDLKLENILFKDVEDLYVKVIDFGISGVCTAFQADMVDAGTIAYMAPECFEGSVASSPSLDVWAIGLMFYAMLYGTLPFYGQTESQTKQKIKEARLKFPADIPVTAMGKDLIKMMLNKDPEQRLDLLEFMEMRYYSIEDAELDREIGEVTAIAEQIAAAEEEKRSEEQKLAQQFQATLELPSYMGHKSSAAGSRSGISPNRSKPAKKKVSKMNAASASGSSPRSGATGASSAARTHKNKKTTK